jgi:acetoin utilization deacetylase AcuC-like enzyme
LAAATNHLVNKPFRDEAWPLCNAGDAVVTTLLLSHAACLAHETPLGHPERADRMRAIALALSAEAFQPLLREDAPMAGHEPILRCHSERHLAAMLAAAPGEGHAAIDADTVMSPGTIEAALRAAGGAVAAVDAVMQGRAANAFVATRPPGHHAEHARAMGFCFFNNAAIAARHARIVHGAERVAVFDWDVHHGNGTQDILWADPSTLYISSHEMPLYPGTGAPSEAGEHGTILNVALAAGDGGEAFRAVLDSVILPRLNAFQPDLIIISAGFDAHWRDPLASLNLTEGDFAQATRDVMDIADRRCGGRVVSLLEGGYDLQGLSASVAVHVAELMRA